MRTKWCLLGCFLYCFTLAQSFEVKSFYQISNEIDKKFATSGDTISWLNQNLYLLKKYQGTYADLGYHRKFVPLIFKYLGKNKCRTYVKLMAKYSIAYDAELKSLILDTNIDPIMTSINAKKIINKNQKNYSKLYSDFNLYTALFAGNYDQLDQGVRSFPDLIIDNKLPAVYYGDSLNLVSFYNNVETFGFPTPSEVGALNYFFLFFHTIARPTHYNNIKYENNQNALEYIDSVLLKAVDQGSFRNNQYAYFKDLASVNLCGKQIYGTLYSAGLLKYPLLSAKDTDAKRNKILLPPLWVSSKLNGFSLPENYEKR